MKRTIDMKRIIASLTAAGLLTTGASCVFADSAAEDITAAQDSIVAEDSVLYNGSSIILQSAEINGQAYVPLRQAMEALGYTVTWNAETQNVVCRRGAVELGLTVGQDLYYFSKTAPAPIGAAPVLYNDEVTYVPVQFLTEVAGAAVYYGEENGITVVEPASVTVNSVSEDANGNVTLSVQDALRGEVIVRISEDTKVSQGLDIQSLESGSELLIGYGVAMTMSIPPQTTAISVALVQADAQSSTSAVTVKSVEDDEFGGFLMVEDENLGEVKVRVGDDTLINGVKSTDLSGISAGQTIEIVYSDAMTMSIPPQTTAVSINTSSTDRAGENTAIENAAFEGVIVSVSENSIVIDENGSERALNITDETRIFHGNDKRIYGIDDLTEGVKVRGEREAVETRSIPPISNAVSVEIVD